MRPESHGKLDVVFELLLLKACSLQDLASSSPTVHGRLREGSIAGKAEYGLSDFPHRY